MNSSPLRAHDDVSDITLTFADDCEAQTHPPYTSCCIKMARCRSCINYWGQWNGLGCGLLTGFCHLSRSLSALRCQTSVMLPAFYMPTPTSSTPSRSTPKALENTKEILHVCLPNPSLAPTSLSPPWPLLFSSCLLPRIPLFSNTTDRPVCLSSSSHIP